MNKTKKVLSIILLSLLILSTVFTLMKKVGLCASSSNSGIYVHDFPLPYGNNSRLGIPSFVSLSSVDSAYSYAISNVGAINGYIFGYGGDTQDYYYLTYFRASDWSSTGFNGVDTIIYFNMYEWHDVEVRKSDGAVTNISHGNNNGRSYSLNLSYISQVSPSGSLELLPDRPLNAYPLGIIGDSPVDQYGNTLFTGFVADNFSNSDWQQITSTITQGQQAITLGGEITSATQPDTLWGYLKNWLQSIIYSIFSGIQFLYDNFVSFFDPFIKSVINFCIWLTDFLDPFNILPNLLKNQHGTSYLSLIFDKLSDFLDSFEDFTLGLFDDLEDFIEGIWDHLPGIIQAPYRIANWFYQHGLNNYEFDFMTLWHYLFDFDSTAALNTFSSNKYGDFVLDVRDFFNTFFGSIINQNASSRVFFVIPIGSHFGSDVGDVEINFDWYSSIRDNYLPYFMAFLYVSIIWLFFKRLPDILRGVAGAESSFTDALPYETDSKVYTSQGVYSSHSTVSHGGRVRVTQNSFTKN